MSPDLHDTANQIFVGCQLFKPHRASRMQLLRADPDLCTESEFKPICKACGRIGIHAGGIDFLQELFCVFPAPGKNGIGMLRIITVNMCNGFFQG